MKKVRGSKTAINLEDQQSVQPRSRRDTRVTPERSDEAIQNKLYEPRKRKYDISKKKDYQSYTISTSPIRISGSSRDKSPSFQPSPIRNVASDTLGTRYRVGTTEDVVGTGTTSGVRRTTNTVTTTSPISKKPGTVGEKVTTTTTVTSENITPPGGVSRPRVYRNPTGVGKPTETNNLAVRRNQTTPLKPIEISNVIDTQKDTDIGIKPIGNYGAPNVRYGGGVNISPTKFATNPLRVTSQPTVATPTRTILGTQGQGIAVSPMRNYGNVTSYQPVTPYRKNLANSAYAGAGIIKPVYGTNNTAYTSNYTTPVYRERNQVAYSGIAIPSPLRATRVYSPVRATTLISPVRRVYSPYRVVVPTVPIVAPIPRTPLRAKSFVMEGRRPYTPKYMVPVDKPELQRSIVRGGGPIPPHEPDPYLPPKSYKIPQRINVIPPERTARREVTKITEVLDADISDRDYFFNNYQTQGAGLDIGDTLANKISMNDEGTTIYASGLNGTSVVGVNGPNLTKLGPTEVERPSTTVECVRDGHVILQEPNSNNLFLVDRDLNTVKAIDGLGENGKVVEDLHHYRHSQDYAYFLWRSGQDNLSIIDTDTFECVEVIQQFWTFENASTMPVAACANVNADRIVATSQAGPDNYIIHYYEDSIDQNVAYAKPIGAVVPSMYQVTALETSADERRVYLGGLAIVDGRAGSPVVITCMLNDSLREISANLLDELDFGAPRRIVRKEGTEVIFIGCDRHIAIMEFIGDRLQQWASLPNIHDNEITDMVIRGRFLYTTAFNEPLIKATEFNIGGINGPPPTTNALTPVAPLLPPGKPNARYGAFRTDKFPYTGLDDLHKVTTSTDGARVFAGGRGLHRFNTAGGQLTPIEIDINKGK